MNHPASSTEVATVEAFLAALEDLDVDRAIALLASDVVYQNVSLPAAYGTEAVGRQLRLFTKYCTGFEARVHRIAASGTTVLTERTDVLSRGSFSAEFWVCGVFEVRDGQVASWRDYFDWANFLTAFAKGAARAAVTALGRR